MQRSLSSSSHSIHRHIVLPTLGPLAALLGVLWAVPILGELVGGPDRVHDGDLARVPLSSVLDDSPRRDRIPMLTRLAVIDVPKDIRGPLLFAGVMGNRLMIVGSAAVAAVDPDSGTVESTIDLGGFIGTAGRVLSSTVVSSRSELWIRSTDRLALLELEEDSAEWRTRLVTLEGKAIEPAWLGDTIVATGGPTLLRFYRVDGTDPAVATLVRRAGEPLMPITESSLQVFLNLVSFAVHPNGQQLVLAFRLSDRLHIYDRDGVLLRAVAGPVEVKLDFDMVPREPRIGGYTFGINGETTMTYLDVDAKQDMIVALFAGQNRNGGATDIFAGDELHVFRWDGTLVGVWRMPEPVVSFQLDEAGRRIYAVRRSPSWSVIQVDASPIHSGEIY